MYVHTILVPMQSPASANRAPLHNVRVNLNKNGGDNAAAQRDAMEADYNQTGTAPMLVYGHLINCGVPGNRDVQVLQNR